MYLLFSRKLIEPVSVHDINPDLEGEVTSFFPERLVNRVFLTFYSSWFSSLLPREVPPRAGLGWGREVLYNEFHYTFSSYRVPRRDLSSLSNLLFYLVSEIHTYLSYICLFVCCCPTMICVRGRYDT